MLHVTCAIIEHHGKILICQRSEKMKLPLKWEFPGGKIEPRESQEQCLRREIREELGLEIEVREALQTVEYNDGKLSLYLYPFLCRWTAGELEILEHRQAIWIDRSALKDYDWSPADIPIVNEINK